MSDLAYRALAAAESAVASAREVESIAKEARRTANVAWWISIAALTLAIGNFLGIWPSI